MRTKVLALGLAIGLLATGPSQGLAQLDQPVVVRGMFGDRVLRQPLAPKLSTSRPDRTGLARSASGMFLGRGAGNSSLMFPGMPWQYRTPGLTGNEPLAAPVQRPSPAPPAPPEPLPPQAMPGEGEAPPPTFQGVPAAAPVPSAPAGPDQWLRTPGGAAAGPTSASPPARPMPPPLQLGFTPSPYAENPATAVAQLIGRVSQIEKRSAITVGLENETAVLRGRVATERDRLLAESIARLQPGIWRVQNELVVENPSATAPKSFGR